MKNKILILGLIAAAGYGFYTYNKSKTANTQDSPKASELKAIIANSQYPEVAKKAIIEAINKFSLQELSDYHTFIVVGGGECNTLPLDVCTRIEGIFSKYDLNKYFIG